MPNPFFQFKQFTVWHDKCAMKVGTDGVLLGAWTSVESAHRILDIGTGTGLVALMLAQRSLAAVVALEIEEWAALQAAENVARSPWPDRIEVIREDFRLYTSDAKFDVIVSNPPYFVDGLKGPDGQRNAARHNDGLSYEPLLQGVATLLTADGLFTLVIPTDVAERVKEIAQIKGLYPSKQLFVVTKPGAAPKRTLITFGFHPQACSIDTLLTEVARHQYSDEYIALTKMYYLNL